MPSRCRTVVYVIDRSMSMGLNGALQAAKRELAASLEHLPPEARFQVVFYNRYANPLRINGSCGLAPATRANLDAVEQALAFLDADGGTLPAPALELALLWKPEVIYFLTDGADLRDEDARRITGRNAGVSVIHVVQLISSRGDADNPALRALAGDKGTYRVVPVRGRPWNGLSAN
jgi:hypothetical protein